ncbi:MAG: two-component sensor histidine kinase [Alphaproteobacteria bacterium]|nr:two-component sensor histidine kinase [Alphaproteobacteria bacterium]
MTADALMYLQALPTALVAVSPALQVLYLNPAAENLLALSMGQAEGRPLSALPGFEENLCALCARCLSEGEAMRLLEQPFRMPGHVCNITLQLTPVFGAEGASQQLLISIDKADGLDKLAASAWKQEATRTAGVMAAMLAHEVKNPLSGIRGAAQLLRDDVTEEQQPLTDLICSEVDRVRELLDQVEVFAGGVPGELQPVNIHEVLQYVMSIAKTGFAQHVTFREKYDPSLPLVLGHRDLMVQLFLNVVKNSAEALQNVSGATITLSTAYRSGQRISLDKTGERVPLPIMVSVEDNGAGIPEGMRARLFEPFITSKEGGRGLGLAIVAKLASDLGALVELDETALQGAKFVVSLAAASQQLTQRPQSLTLAAQTG